MNWPATSWRSAPNTTPSPGSPRRTPTCAPGGVDESHFGANPGEDEDPRVDGANTNRLLRNDVEYDRYTGIPRMGALAVAVVAAAPVG
jgi:hypothetical protein